MIFVFEIRNKLDHNLGFTLSEAGPDWKRGMSPGERRKLRATADELRRWLPHLESAFEKEQIDLSLKSELDVSEAAFLKKLDSPIFQALLEDAEPARFQRLFISHATVDRAIAERIDEEIQHRLPSLDTFVASRPGDIQGGKEWFEAVKTELKRADAYLIVLTPNSVKRPWVIFETGAGWIAEGKFLTVSAGIQNSEIPEPLRFFQVWSLESEETARLAFRELGDAGKKLGRFCDEIRELVANADEKEKETNCDPMLDPILKFAGGSSQRRNPHKAEMKFINRGETILNVSIHPIGSFSASIRPNDVIPRESGGEIILRKVPYPDAQMFELRYENKARQKCRKIYNYAQGRFTEAFE